MKNPINRPSLKDIQEAVARHYGTTAEMLRGPVRSRYVGYPRMIAIWLVKYFHPYMTDQWIGKEFGDRDQSSVNRMRHQANTSHVAGRLPHPRELWEMITAHD